jgi:hypothetical protein
MTTYCDSTEQILNNLLSYCDTALKTTVSDPGRESVLTDLARSVCTLENFVRGYQWIDDPSLDTDDEILNWAFAEMPTDFSSAIWLLASGFYKASASSLRNALDISTASLYFQIRQNTDPAVGNYNRFFAEWDRGDRQTPGWGEMKPFISKQPSVASFRANTGNDIVEQAYDHFRYLCAYTHTSAFAPNGDPVTAINMTGVAPIFDERFFVRGCELTSRTASIIAMLWQVTFPQIITTEPLGPLSSGAYSVLFPPPTGPLTLSHR